MSRRAKIVWIVIGTVLLLLALRFIPYYGQICEPAGEARVANCTSHQLLPFIVLEAAQFLDKMGGAITAVATIAIAIFTFTLKRATDKLWDAGERQLNLLAATSAAQSKNGGMTPAINARMNISHNRFNNEMPADYHFPDSTNFGNALIGPQLIWHTPSITIPASELERPLVGAFHYLWGWIEYDDIFSGTTRHRTEFCFKIECERLQPTNEFWVGFAPHSKFNAADEDCLRPIDPGA